eukprot:PhM_4_TR1320/c1_g1_i1/m.101083
MVNATLVEVRYDPHELGVVLLEFLVRHLRDLDHLSSTATRRRRATVIAKQVSNVHIRGRALRRRHDDEVRQGLQRGHLAARGLHARGGPRRAAARWCRGLGLRNWRQRGADGLRDWRRGVRWGGGGRGSNRLLLGHSVHVAAEREGRVGIGRRRHTRDRFVWVGQHGCRAHGGTVGGVGPHGTYALDARVVRRGEGPSADEHERAILELHVVLQEEGDLDALVLEDVQDGLAHSGKVTVREGCSQLRNARGDLGDLLSRRGALDHGLDGSEVVDGGRQHLAGVHAAHHLVLETHEHELEQLLHRRLRELHDGRVCDALEEVAHGGQRLQLLGLAQLREEFLGEHGGGDVLKHAHGLLLDDVLGVEALLEDVHHLAAEVVHQERHGEDGCRQGHDFRGVVGRVNAQ